MRSLKIRLELNNKQQSYALQHCGVSRHAYNWGLSICKDALDNKIKVPSSIDLHKLLVRDVKSVYKWYYDVSKCSPQQSLRNLDISFKRCFKKTSKFPKFKKKGVNDSFYLEGNIQIKGNLIKVPKFGWIKMSEIINDLTVKNCVISRIADEWFISFKIPFVPIKTIKKYTSVGVDLGIKSMATLSNGEIFENLRPYKNAKRKLRKQQKEVSRKYVKGTKNQSSNYKKSKIKLAKTHQTVANTRKDSLHKLTTYLAKTFNTVVIEDLNVKGMSKNHNLASAILDGGFFEFKRQLMYKKEWYGGSVILANRFFPSSKLCSSCGSKKEVLKLSEREYCCTECSIIMDRDFNASINLNNLAVSSTVIAFGDKSSIEKQFSIQLVGELGIKHQMSTFV